MKLFFYNDQLGDPESCGSFTVVAKQGNLACKELGILGDSSDPNTIVIYPEGFDVTRKFSRMIPFLACEWNFAPSFVVQGLKPYPLILAISNFARNNLINSGVPANKVKSVHLGCNSKIWYPVYIKKRKEFTYLTVIASNERSGLEYLIPAWLKFSKGKDVRLIIKDGENPKFKDYIQSLRKGNIIYIDDRFSEQQMRELYSQCHIFLYNNNTTSFGMTPLEASLCALPVITTKGSALQEFIPEWNHLKTIKTEYKPLNLEQMKIWDKYGFHRMPDNFLGYFPSNLACEHTNEKDILKALEYSFNHYGEYLDVGEKLTKYVKENLTWEKTILNIVNILLEQKDLSYGE